MAINPSEFYLHNIVDTCAVWNILSSKRLFCAARQANVTFAYTRVVEYECLYKPRNQVKPTDTTLQNRLRSASKSNDFSVYSLDVSDLQTIEILQKRKRLGKGELSSIAFAIKVRQAVLTDDQKARKLACEILPPPGVQTTPHLFGWLIFTNRLSDLDKKEVVREHVSLGGPLSRYFEDIYLEALRCRLLACGTSSK